MELLAMTMRAEGMLSCRSLSFKGWGGPREDPWGIPLGEARGEALGERRLTETCKPQPTGASFRLVPVKLEELSNVYSQARKWEL